jgi:3-oxoacyl-[acyl-carrier protein] reductase
VRDPAEVREVARAASEFGGGRIDILVNNAGGLVRRAPFAEVTPELVEETMRLNFVSAVVACGEIIPGMAARGYGRVVNIGSVAAHTGNATNHHYAAAKAALTSLGRSLTKEYAGRGVTVNTIAPGLIDNAFHVVHTPRAAFEALLAGIPAGRAGTDQDIAAAVAYLVSEGAGYVSGNVLHVNGGLYVS